MRRMRCIGVVLCAAAGASAQPVITPGTWEGTWTNLTFGSSGPLDAMITVDGSSVTGALNADGNVFGEADPAPFVLEGTLSDGPLVMTLKMNPTLGDLLVTVEEDGSVSVTGKNVPNPGIVSFTATGTLSEDTLHLDGAFTYFGTPVMTTIDGVLVGGACPADYNGDGQLNILDFVAFQQGFGLQDPDADCDGNGQFNILDFVCFQQAFGAGC